MSHRPLVAAIFLLALASPAWAAWPEVGSDQTVGSNSCTGSVALASRTVVSGSVLVLTIATKSNSGGPPALGTPTDDNSGSWSCTSYAPDVVRSGAICIASNHAAGATIVTVPFTSGVATCAVMADLSEWTPPNPVVTFDQVSQNTGSGSPQSTGTTSTTTQASELAIAQDIYGNESSSPTQTGGYTALTTIQQGSGTTGGSMASAFLVLTSTGTTVDTWTNTGGLGYIAQVVTLEAPGPTPTRTATPTPTPTPTPTSTPTPTHTPTPTITPTATPTPICGIAPVGTDQAATNGGQVAQVGSDQVGNNAGAACSGSFTMGSRTVGAGNLIALSIGSKSTTGVVTIGTPTDNNGGTYTCEGYAPGGGNARTSAICWAANHAAGATVVTINYSGGSGTCNVPVEMSEWSGLGSTVTLDQFSQNTGTSGTQDTGTTPLLISANELAIAQDVAGTEATTPGSPTNSYTSLTLSPSGSGTTGTALATAFLLIGAPTTTSTAFTAAPTAFIAQVVSLYGSAQCSGSFQMTRTVGGSGSNMLTTTESTNGGYSPKTLVDVPSDDNGGSWTCQFYQLTSTTPSLAVCWAPNHSAGVTHVTIPYHGGTTQCDIHADLSEWTGPSGTVTLDGSSGNHQNASTSPDTLQTATTTANYELALAELETDVRGALITIGPSNGYVAMTQQASGITHGTLTSAWSILQSKQQTSTQWTTAAVTTQDSQVITLKGSSNVCGPSGGGWFFP